MPTDVVELELSAPDGQLLDIDHRRLCSALRVPDPACLTVETDGMSRALVTVYKRPPLATVPTARGEDLVIDAHGFITVGRHHDGDRARMRLYEPGSGAQRGALFGTTGAGKSRALQLVLAAEKRSGVCTWLADLKGGQSVPEARDQVDWRVTTPAELLLMLRAGLAVVYDRTHRYSALGRSFFVLNDPDPLLSIRIDEANVALQQGSDIREEAAYLIKEIGRLGRSVGVGISIAAQAGHLEELGGSDTLRAMLKEGDLVLLRWSSTMMQQLVADGLLPPGVSLVPIPRRSGPPTLRSRFARTGGDEPGASTAGQAYLLGSPRPTALMRFFRVGSLTPVNGLDPEILALYGPGKPRPLEREAWGAAGDVYEQRGGPLTGPAFVAAAHALGEQLETAGVDLTTLPGIPQQQGGPVAVETRPKTAADRVLDALADGPCDKKTLVDTVRQAAETDRVKVPSASRIATVLSELVAAGRIVQPERGRYQLPDQQ